MRLERQHRQRRIGPRGMGGADDAVVAQMDPIEIAQRDGGAARVRRQVPPVMQNPHQAREDTRTQAWPSITTFSFAMRVASRVACFGSGFKSMISTTAVATLPIPTGRD